MSKEAQGARATPDRLTMLVTGLSSHDAEFLAIEATHLAQQMAPKLTGASARNLTPVFGEGFFGIHWIDTYVWFQEVGIKPFTMSRLAGKVIPMWIDDPTGKERQANPKAKTRVTASGKKQILIFRRVAHPGQRKTVTRKVRGVDTPTDVPRSYPGAPGRIGTREARHPWTTPGRVGGAIAQRNVGVRWRHPGLMKRSFIRQGLLTAAQYHGFTPGPIRDSFGRYR